MTDLRTTLDTRLTDFSKSKITNATQDCGLLRDLAKNVLSDGGKALSSFELRMLVLRMKARSMQIESVGGDSVFTFLKCFQLIPRTFRNNERDSEMHCSLHFPIEKDL